MARGPQMGVGLWLQSIALTSEKGRSVAGYLGIDSNHGDKGSQHRSFAAGKTEVLVVIVDPEGLGLELGSRLRIVYMF